MMKSPDTIELSKQDTVKIAQPSMNTDYHQGSWRSSQEFIPLPSVDVGHSNWAADSNGTDEY
jgi:hypothetical protein